MFSKIVDKKTWDNEYLAGRWDSLSKNNKNNNNTVISSIINQDSRTDIIDVGCGEGFLSSLMDKKYLGVDISDVAIKRAREKYNESGVSFSI